MNPNDPNSGSEALTAKANSPLNSGFQISTNSLSKRFNREWIFRNLSLDFYSGNRYCVTGPNGSGKSTLLHVLWGQVPQTSGTILYKKNMTEVPMEEVYNHIAIAAPYVDLIEEFTLEEQLTFHFQLKNIRHGLGISELIEVLALEGSRTKQIGNFSSGMKQRVKLGIGFYTEADVIFLDEPGTNLDAKVFNWYLSEFEKIPQNTITLVASNNPAEYPGKTTELNLLTYK